MTYKNNILKNKKQKEWRKNNPEKIKKYGITNYINRQISTTKIIKDLKINGCAICGYDKYYGALEFHHVNTQTKIFNCNIKSLQEQSTKKYGLELNKCILLCSNCHREIHKNGGI